MNNNFISMWNNMLKSIFGSYITTEKPIRKKNDSTKFTQYHYDFIIYAYRDMKIWNMNNPKDKKTTMELTAVINSKMGTHKSVTSLARIWNGKVDRNSLAVGTKDFEY